MLQLRGLSPSLCCASDPRGKEKWGRNYSTVSALQIFLQFNAIKNIHLWEHSHATFNIQTDKKTSICEKIVTQHSSFILGARIQQNEKSKGDIPITFWWAAFPCVYCTSNLYFMVSSLSPHSISCPRPRLSYTRYHQQQQQWEVERGRTGAERGNKLLPTQTKRRWKLRQR